MPWYTSLLIENARRTGYLGIKETTTEIASSFVSRGASAKRTERWRGWQEKGVIKERSQLKLLQDHSIKRQLLRPRRWSLRN